MARGIPLESHRNVNKISTCKWEWQGVRMDVYMGMGNGNDSYSREEKFPRTFFCLCRLASGCRPILYMLVFILENDSINIFFDFQITVNGVFRIFTFQRLMHRFLWNCFSAVRPSTVCIYAFLFCCVFVNEVVMEITQWKSHGNGNKT